MTAKQIENRIIKLQALEAQKKEIDTLIAEIKAAIQAEMGDAETIDAGRFMVRWTHYETPKFDSKAFKAAHPKMYEKFITVTRARRFSFSEK